MASVAEAKGAAAKLIETVLRKPSIDVASEQGQKLSHVKGKLEFKNIKFRYPARPEAQVREEVIRNKDMTQQRQSASVYG